ncbi:MAG: TPR domain-containing protein [Alphaproteobacteria bacterium]
MNNDIIFIAITAAIIFFVIWIILSPRWGRFDQSMHQDDTRLDILKHQYQQATDEGDRAKLLMEVHDWEQHQRKASQNTTPHIWLRATIIILLPVLTIVTYLLVGNPTLATFDPEDALSPDALKMISSAENRLAKNPADARGWFALGQTYLGTGQPQKAIDAMQKAFSLEPNNTHKLGLAEARFIAAGLKRDQMAMTLLTELFRDDPNQFRVRYYLGLQAVRDRQYAAAKALLMDIFDPRNMQAPWYNTARDRLVVELERMGAELADIGISKMNTASGPSPDDIRAAESLSAEDRASMIRGMVERLEDKLKADPSNVSQWLRLIQAYGVLGWNDKVPQALHQARSANPESLDLLILSAADEKQRHGKIVETTKKLLLNAQTKTLDPNLKKILEELLGGP